MGSGKRSILYACTAVVFLAVAIDTISGVVCDATVPERPESADFTAALRRLPERHLKKSERKRLQRDGVAIVRNALTSKSALALLRNATNDIESPTECNADWRRNGVVRSLLRDGPIGALAGSALEVVTPTSDGARIAESVVFNIPGDRESAGERGGAHIDVDSPSAVLEPMVTVWLALSKAPHALEFLAGSHHELSPPGCEGVTDLDPDSDCLLRLQKKHAWRSWDMQPGDALVFNSQVWHRSVTAPRLRSALAMRFVAANARFEGAVKWTIGVAHLAQWWKWPWTGGSLAEGPLFPLVHPREAATVGRA